MTARVLYLYGDLVPVALVTKHVSATRGWQHPNNELRDGRAKWERIKGLRENRETHDAGTKSTILCMCVLVGLRKSTISSCCFRVSTFDREHLHVRA
jgi:hypothetical protein